MCVNFNQEEHHQKNTPDYYQGSIPWITTVALNGSYINESSDVEWITEKAIEESAAKAVQKNSIMAGTCVGVGKAAINTVLMSTGQDIIALLDIDESRWDKNYICKYILGKHDYLISQAMKWSLSIPKRKPLMF